MMKKLQNIAAIFAAGALLLGAASCSHDGGASLAALSNTGAGGGGGGGGGAGKTTDSWTVENISQFTNLTSKDVISSDITIAGASGNLQLTASATGTGVGTTKMSTTPSSYQYVANKGLLIKKDALKIAGVKGSVKLTIEWYCNSDEASKQESERRVLEVTVGADGETKTQAVNMVGTTGKTQGKMDDFALDVAGGENGVDIYIGASNELYIQKITIE